MAMATMQPTEQGLHSYVNGLQQTEYDIASNVADQVYLHGKPLADTFAIVPVAAGQEQSTVGPALDQYARQQPLRPFSVVLGFNTDHGTHHYLGPEVTASLAAADRAQARYPYLDIRTAFTAYDGEPIGARRRDIWNGVLMAALEDSGSAAARPLVGVNHDIDTVYMPHRYMGNVQRHMADPAHATLPAYTQIRHAWDAAHPNTSRIISWRDYTTLAAELAYEAGTVIPMQFYAHKGGFNPDDKLREVANLVVKSPGLPPLIPTGTLLTSPRRMVYHLPDVPMDQVWTPETFLAEDPCRSAETVAAQPDLSDLTRSVLLRGQVERDVATILDGVDRKILHALPARIAHLRKQGFRPDSIEEDVYRGVPTAVTRYRRKLAAAERVFGLCLGEPHNPRTFAFKTYKNRIRNLAHTILEQV
jgi:hypothetical protein